MFKIPKLAVAGLLAAFVSTSSVVSGPALSASEKPAPDELFGAINDRLGYMQPVAAWKVENSRPVEDLEREKVVLDAAREKASEKGLSPESASAFFQAQIDAAKDIQFCWMARWEKGETRPDKVPDLVEEVRPELLRLGNEILDRIAETHVSEDNRQTFIASVDVECLSTDARNAIFEGLLEIRQ